MGAIAPPGRDAAACNKPTSRIRSKKSLQKTAITGSTPSPSYPLPWLPRGHKSSAGTTASAPAPPWTTWCVSPGTFGVVSTAPVRPCTAPPAPKKRDGSPGLSTEFGLDVLAWVGPLRSAQHRRLPAISPHVRHRGATAPPGRSRLSSSATTHGCPSHALLPPAGRASPKPRAGASAPVGCCPRRNQASPYGSGPCATTGRCLVSDGPLSSRGAVAEVCPAVPHPLGHFQERREAAPPMDDAARHAKHARKKRVRGGRPRARRLAGRHGPEAEVVRGDWAAGRRALTADGRPPLDASGLTRHNRFPALPARLERGDKRGPGPRHGVG